MTQRLCPVIVGREAELEALRGALTSAAAGEGGCVVLAGEPGIGKSRLAREVAGWAADRSVRVVAGRAVPGSASTPYRPLAEALLQLLRRRSLPDDPTLAPWLPALQPMLPSLIPVHDSSEEVSPNLRAEAVLQLLGRVSPGGLVAVLEDLHWADPDTLSVIEYLADNLRAEHVLLVMTLRNSPPSPASEVVQRLRGRPGITHLGLDRLGDDAQAAMVQACDPDATEAAVRRVQDTADGVPLLVEELLASPGTPDSFVATVRARLETMDAAKREVIEAAAVLGRDFDWTLLCAMVGQNESAVTAALSDGVASLLLTTQGTTFRFRHALTREAVLETMIPPRQRVLATAGLAALDGAYPTPDGRVREVGVDLAQRAGDRRRAGRLLLDSGRESRTWGALATAADTLRRASDLLAGTAEQSDAELELVATLALAGRVEEVAAVGARLVTRLAADPDMVAARADVHLRLAQAAVAASRWAMARHHLGEATRLAGSDPSPAVAARIAVLSADVTMAGDDHEAARALVDRVLAMDDVEPDVRCHALEIVGRIDRSSDLAAARAALEEALVTAESADLPVWRMRALHELGILDLFHHAGVARLLEARRAAEQMGAVSTAAILDLQLSAGYTARWDLDACDEHARSAIGIAERLGLDQVRAKALGMLTGSAGMRADVAETERYAALSVSAAPEDQWLDGYSWGIRGMALLMRGDVEAAMEPYGRGMAILGRLPHGEPAAVRALWPLVLAARSDDRAQRAVDEARRLGVSAIHVNRGLVGYAEAILAGRRGDARRARETIAVADTGFANCDALPALARQCEELLRDASPNPWSTAGVSAREADVLRLVAEGLANKDIAARLHLSPRTVEKHVESLLRKLGARSRTELVRLSIGGTADPSLEAT